MCGITGFIDVNHNTYDMERSIRRMSDAMRSRGPDASGHWVDREIGVALGHRRLSILELSEKGAQPMLGEGGNLILTYNGEIYNFAELKSNLEQNGSVISWRGDSDTEVLLQCFTRWGIEDTLKRCKGMFAFALWNRKSKKLTLGRDRFGEKPLYYGWQTKGKNRVFLFGSDLSALKQHTAFDDAIDAQSVQLLTQHLYIPAPWSIYKSVKKLMPGSMLVLDLDSDKETNIQWWNLKDEATVKQQNKFTGSDEQAIERLETVLGDAVERQFVSDVPLGAFLSGGIDSSLIVALMQQRSLKPVKTFTIGFDNVLYNEADDAQRVADHLGTDHQKQIVTSADALQVIPKLCTIYSEPFADSSQIPTYLLSQFARKHVSVALSGDAGDEMFCGYNRYNYVKSNWRRLEATPILARKIIARLLLLLPADHLNHFGQKYLPNTVKLLGDKAHKTAEALTSQSLDNLYRRLISPGFRNNEIIANSATLDSFAERDISWLEELDPVSRMMALDSIHYMPDDILAKVDRAAMACSLETRVPFLDPDVANFALSLTPELRIRSGQTKWLLRQLLYRHVPQQIIDRPKMGFGVPIGSWLRGPLRDWAESMLFSESFQNNEIFHALNIQTFWNMHQKGTRNLEHKLWPVLMYASWLQAN